MLDNPYGNSKRKAEEALVGYQETTGGKVFIFRLTNVFGKFCKPFYNSVVATYCYQATHGQELRVDDPNRLIDFIYIDDVIKSFVGIIDGQLPVLKDSFVVVQPLYPVSLSELARKIENLKENRKKGVIPDFRSLFDKYLYSTFLSYLEKEDFAYLSEKKQDSRGYLFELIKSDQAGQVFVSRTSPGVTRGNHYHHTKIEKFCVVDGIARISFVHTISHETIDYVVEGLECKVVDIPPGWAHRITNIGERDLITIFWANEIFDQGRSDTYSLSGQ